MIHNLTSINVVISKIVRDLNLGDQELPWEDFIEWIAEGLKHIGSFYQFTERTTTIDITDYKAELPCDFYKLTRILSGTYLPQYNSGLILNGIDNDASANRLKITNYDYNLNHNIITTSYKTATIDIQYLAMPIDENGYPLVPDDVSFFDALFWRVTYMLCLRGHEFKNTQLRDLNFTKRKWDFYCVQARANANMPDVEAQERMKNIFLRFKTSVDDYSRLFANTGIEQKINLNGKG